MELPKESQTIEYLQEILWEQSSMEESLETVISDSLPDVQQVLYADGAAVMTGKEVYPERVSVTGGIMAHVLYLPPESSEPQCLEVYVPYHLQQKLPHNDRRIQVVYEQKLLSVRVRIVNSRKLSVSCVIACEIRGYLPWELTLPSMAQQAEEVQVHCSEYTVTLPVDIGETSVGTEQTVTIPPCTCGQTVALSITDTRLAGNKAVFKGEACISLLCAGENGGIEQRKYHIPFSQYCPLQRQYEEETVEILPVLTGLDFRETENQETEIVLDLSVQAVVYSRQTLFLWDDAYCTCGTLTPRWQELNLKTLLDKTELSAEVKGATGYSPEQIKLCTLEAGYPGIQRTEAGILLQTPVYGRILCTREDGTMEGEALQFFCETELPAESSVLCRVKNAAVGEPHYKNTPEGTEISAGLTMTVETSADTAFSTLQDADYEATGEERQPACIKVRRLAEEQRLWDLAKANRTTVDSLRRANHLEENAETVSGVVLIPKK